MKHFLFFSTQGCGGGQSDRFSLVFGKTSRRWACWSVCFIQMLDTQKCKLNKEAFL